MEKNYTSKQLEGLIARQQDQSDCGVAAMQTVIAWHGGHALAEDIRIASGTNISGTTLLGLYQAAADFGLDAEAYEMDIEHLLAQKRPCILHLLLDGQRLHYMVYLGYNAHKNELLLGDPAKGLSSLSHEALAQLWTSKSALLLCPNKQFVSKKENKREKRDWFLNSLREDVPLLGISLFLGLAIATMGLSTAIFSQKLIDELLPARNSQHIAIGLGLLFAILMARALATYLRQHVVLLQSQAYNNRITGLFIDKLLHLPKLFFDSRKSGDMIARLNDTQRIQRNISYLAGNVAIDVLVSLIGFVALFAYSWQIGLLLLGFVPLVIWLVHRYTPSLIKWQTEVMAAYAQTESHYINTIQGIATVKENSAQHFFAAIGRSAFGHYQDRIFGLGRCGNRFGLKAEALAALIHIALIATSVHMVFGNKLSIGEMMAVLSISSLLLPSVGRLAQINLQVQEAKIAFDRMYDFVKTNTEAKDEGHKEGLNQFHSLRLEQLGFRFKGRKALFSNVNFHLRKGELISLMGNSGMGKSTLMQLIQGFYQPNEGKLLVNGLPLHHFSTAAWRSKIATIPQDIKVFSGSLYANVVLDKLCPIEDFHAFCQAYGFDRYFLQLPMGYATPVGEEGVNLSGGQKQLMALARAIYKKPGLLLLDEATSALDQQAESFVLQLLQKLRADMAILLITHRPQLASLADRAYILEQGTVCLLSERNVLSA